MTALAATSAPKPRRLLDQVRDKLRTLHYSPRTEDSYVSWIKRYIWFHDKRHPRDMGPPEVEAFLSHLATQRGSRRPRRTRPYAACCSCTSRCWGWISAGWTG